MITVDNKMTFVYFRLITENELNELFSLNISGGGFNRDFITTGNEIHYLLFADEKRYDDFTTSFNNLFSSLPNYNEVMQGLRRLLARWRIEVGPSQGRSRLDGYQRELRVPFELKTKSNGKIPPLHSRLSNKSGLGEQMYRYIKEFNSPFAILLQLWSQDGYLRYRFYMVSLTNLYFSP